MFASATHGGHNHNVCFLLNSICKLFKQNYYYFYSNYCECEQNANMNSVLLLNQSFFRHATILQSGILCSSISTLVYCKKNGKMYHQTFRTR